MEYNTGRNELVIREYGRNIQKMIEYAMTIDDYDKRTEAAKSIVRIMSQVNPDVKESIQKNGESSDYWHKLWDHLFIISGYRLEVDSPFPKPEPEKQQFEVISPEYHKKKIAYRTYGRNIENIIKKVSEYPEEDRIVLGKLIANHLKKLYLMYNRDSVDDALIIQQLSDLSDGKINLPADFVMDATKDILRQNQQSKPINKQNGGGKKNKKKKKKTTS